MNTAPHGARFFVNQPGVRVDRFPLAPAGLGKAEAERALRGGLK